MQYLFNQLQLYSIQGTLANGLFTVFLYKVHVINVESVEMYIECMWKCEMVLTRWAWARVSAALCVCTGDKVQGTGRREGLDIMVK